LVEKWDKIIERAIEVGLKEMKKSGLREI